MKIAVSITIALGMIGLSQGAGSGYSYAGKYYWQEQYPDHCSGLNQSPINIIRSNVMDVDMDPLVFTGYGSISGAFVNTGTTVQFNPAAGESLPYVTGGVLGDDVYDFLQFHFHWGSSGDVGSEHEIDGKAYPLEVHLVHINAKYSGDVPSALANADGLAVMGFMFQVTGNDNPALDSTVDAVKDLKGAFDADASVDSSVDLASFIDFVGPMYYNYPGGLTTPTCNEVVTWMVFEKAIPVSAKQLKKFRQLSYYDDTPMVDNWRPVQPVNNRVVKRVNHMPVFDSP